MASETVIYDEIIEGLDRIDELFTTLEGIRENVRILSLQHAKTVREKYPILFCVHKDKFAEGFFSTREKAEDYIQTCETPHKYEIDQQLSAEKKPRLLLTIDKPFRETIKRFQFKNACNGDPVVEKDYASRLRHAFFGWPTNM